MDSETLIPARNTNGTANTSLPAPEYDCPVYAWTETYGRYTESIPAFIAQVCTRFAACGLPLDRASILIRTLHPQIDVAGYVWRADAQEVEVFSRDHQTQSSQAYQHSPVRAVFEGSPGLRRKLLEPDCRLDYPILEDLAKDGFTDYLIVPIPFSDGRTYACSWSTRHPDGFSDMQIGRITQLMPTFSLVMEILALRTIAQNLMDTYLGHSAGQRVLDGQIHRGANETIDAVIWISDLRGFTRLSDEFAPPVVLGVLNDHFERVVGAIGRHGGEVLKFMGDSVLAIFPLASFGSPDRAAEAALAAAAEAEVCIADGNRVRAEKGLTEIRYGIALHLGEVVYGNIGAADRLDFTVIGPAVNQTARIEALCRTLSRNVLLSASLAHAVRRDVQSLGFHVLRGVREPQEIFTLPDEGATGG